jgi:aryl-alcohol dehydrogenase-like predicted oxidoreductase
MEKTTTGPLSLSGVNSVQLSDNLGAMRLKLSKEQIARLDSAA